MTSGKESSKMRKSILGKWVIRMAILCLLMIVISAPVVMAAASEVTVQSETLSPNRKNYAMVKGEKLYLSVRGYSGKVSWKSDNKSVITIGAKNIIAAKAKGTAKITGTYGKKKIVLTVQVQYPVLNLKKAVMQIGARKQLKVTGTNRTIQWTSSDRKVAAVNSKGLVTAKSAGTATVSAVIHGVSFSCQIGVKNADGVVPTPTPYPYVKVTQAQLKKYLNTVLSRYDSKYYLNSYCNDLQTYPYQGNGASAANPVPSIPSYASNDPRQFSDIRWKNSDSAVASLNGTELKIKKAGTTTLTASLKAKDGTSATVSKTITVVNMKKYYKTVTVYQADMPKYFRVSGSVTRNGNKVITYLPKKLSDKWILAGYAGLSGQSESFFMMVEMSNATSSGTITRTSSFTDPVIKAWNTDVNGKTTYTYAYPSLFFEIPANETVKGFLVRQMSNGKVNLMYVDKAALCKKKEGTSYGGFDIYSTIDGKAKVQVP